jgi:hypothetical protein
MAYTVLFHIPVVNNIQYLLYKFRKQYYAIINTSEPRDCCGKNEKAIYTFNYPSIIKQLDIGHQLQFPVLITHKYACDVKVVRLLRTRGAGNTLEHCRSSKRYGNKKKSYHSRHQRHEAPLPFPENPFHTAPNLTVKKPQGGTVRKLLRRPAQNVPNPERGTINSSTVTGIVLERTDRTNSEEKNSGKSTKESRKMYR